MSPSNKGRGGLVVNIASICGILYTPFLAAYVASKHGVLSFTKCMAVSIA